MKLLIIWWQARLPRERVLLFCLSALLFCGLLQIIWHHAVTFKEDAQQNLRRELQALKILPDLERALQLRKDFRPVYRNEPDIGTINGLAKQSGLKLHLTKGEKVWSLRETVRVDFSMLVTFLALLESQYGLTAETLQLEREKQHVRLIRLELKHVK